MARVQLPSGLRVWYNLADEARTKQAKTMLELASDYLYWESILPTGTPKQGMMPQKRSAFSRRACMERQSLIAEYPVWGLAAPFMVPARFE
jgi:hypothetical protein